MSDNTIASNLHRIRKMVGISQRDLSEKVGISRKAYGNIEKATSIPKADTLRALAEALGVEIQELVKPFKELEEVRFRSQGELKSREGILRDVSVWLGDFNELEDLLNEKSEYTLRDLEDQLAALNGANKPAEAAMLTREAMGLSEKEPIRDIWGLLESCGFKVQAMSLANDGFFGLSVGEGEGGPAIVVNTWERISVERWIFTAAHELGHKLLHQDSYNRKETKEPNKEEKEANVFASHFLMPEPSFKSEWDETYGMPMVDRVLKVKRIFHVSYRSVLYRLVESGFMDSSIWGKFQKHYQRRYGRTLLKTDEPEALAKDQFKASSPESLRAGEPERLSKLDFAGTRLMRLVRLAIEKEAITLSRAAEVLGLSLVEMRLLGKEWVE